MLVQIIPNRALPEFYRPAFDPYAEAQPVFECPVCGEPVYAGETYIRWRGTRRIAACEHCAEICEADFV